MQNLSTSGMWAMSPDFLQTLVELSGSHSSVDTLKATRRSGAESMRLVEGVCVIEVSGVLAKKINPFLSFLGATAFNDIAQLFNQAITDPGVKAIILKIDSPGGTVSGTQALANLIFAARGKEKSIVAFVDGLMLSAAAWVGLAADYVVVGCETDQVGSIGVVAKHIDFSEAEKKAGLKITEIISSIFKRTPSSHEPLDEAGRDVLQASVDHIHKAFVNDLAKFRGLSFDQANQQMGNGRIFLGQEAIKRGLADQMCSFEKLVTRLQKGEFSVSRSRPTVATINHPSIRKKEAQAMFNFEHQNHTAKPQPATPALDALHQTPAYRAWLDESQTVRDSFDGNFKSYLCFKERYGLESLRAQLDKQAVFEAEQEAKALERRERRRHKDDTLELSPADLAAAKARFTDNPNYPGLILKEKA